MLVVLTIPGLQSIFEVATLSMNDIWVVIGLTFAPLLIVEVFKLLKINTLKDDE